MSCSHCPVWVWPICPTGILQCNTAQLVAIPTWKLATYKNAALLLLRLSDHRSWGYPTSAPLQFVVRGAPWPASYPGRALRNAFSARWHGHEEALAAEQQGQESAYLATTPDDFTTRVVWAGEGVDLINDIPTASQIIEQIIAQAAEP